MKPLFATAGHQILNSKGTGAFGVTEANGVRFDEAVEARKFVNHLIDHQKKWYGLTTRTENDTDTLNSVINQVVKWMNKDSIAIDFHFNASEAKNATGVEIIIPTVHTEEEVQVASVLANVIAATLDLKKRQSRIIKGIPGVKTEAETAHGTIGMLRKPHIATNLLVEFCFCTNEDDVKAYRKNYWKLVQNLSDALGTYRKL